MAVVVAIANELQNALMNFYCLSQPVIYQAYRNVIDICFIYCKNFNSCMQEKIWKNQDSLISLIYTSIF